jgi:erythromycin esterase
MIGTQPLSPAEWVKRHSKSLAGFEPDLDYGDLEPLREMVENARVVAIGEGAHFVKEFSYMRQRLLRFLSEQCGFNVFAFEYSFSGAECLNDWLQNRDDRRLKNVAPDAAQWGASDLMHWLRKHNALGHAPLRFVGIDLPEAGGALRPVLEPLAEILTQADPASEKAARRAITISDSFLADVDSAAAAAPAWARLPPTARDELSRLLSHLELRISAVQPLLRNRVGAVLADRAA